MNHKYMKYGDPELEGCKGACAPVSVINLRRYYMSPFSDYSPREPRFKALLKRLGYPIDEGGGVYSGMVEKEVGREAVYDKKKAVKYIADGPCLVSVFNSFREENHLFLSYPVADGRIIVINGFHYYYESLEPDSFYKRCGLKRADPCGMMFRCCIPFDVREFKPSYKFE